MKTLAFMALFQLTSTVDLWVKYWPDAIKDQMALRLKIIEYLNTKSINVSIVTFKTIAAQADADGNRIIATITGASLSKQDIDHDALARYLGLNP